MDKLNLTFFRLILLNKWKLYFCTLKSSYIIFLEKLYNNVLNILFPSELVAQISVFYIVIVFFK